MCCMCTSILPIQSLELNVFFYFLLGHFYIGDSVHQCSIKTLRKTVFKEKYNCLWMHNMSVPHIRLDQIRSD